MKPILTTLFHPQNVAQNTVIASYNENVPGRFPSVEPKFLAILHQYATIIDYARRAGNGGSLIIPGGTCTKRLMNSAAVQVSQNGTTVRRTNKRGMMPDVRLSARMEVIPSREFHTGKSCGGGILERRGIESGE
jgi:hypothetical protein